MHSFKKHIFLSDKCIKDALIQLDELSEDAILFVINEFEQLIGSLTDGDIRRGLLSGFTLEDSVNSVMQVAPKFIIKGGKDFKKVIEFRNLKFNIIPIVDQNNKVVNVINFRIMRSYLPVDAVIMAGGRGQRLTPLTNTTPKPLLKVGDKPIIEHNLDRISLFGIDQFWISIKYLGEQIVDYFGDGSKKNINIEYVWEKESLGTIGAVSKITNFKHDYVLLINSDLLTNIDFEEFFLEFISNDADFAVLTIPYTVNIPYAVLETSKGEVKGFKEKPSYTYQSNGGVYLMKKNIVKLIPFNSFYNATDLIEKLIENDFKVVSIPFSGYWLDVGRHEDFEKANIDLNTIKL